MAERNPIHWPEKFGIGIRNRVLGLLFCLEKWDEKITYLVRVTEAYKEGIDALSNSTIELFTLKIELEDVKKGIDEILIQYRDACDQNREKEEEDQVMKELKDFIIEVYKIKRNIDLKIKGLDASDDDIANEDEGESSQDLTAKKGGDGEDHDSKGKGLMIDDSADGHVMKSLERGETSQARAFTELTKDGFLTLSSSSSEEEILNDEFDKKDGDVMKRFLNTVAEAFSLSESESSENENDDVEQQASDSGPEDLPGGVQELDHDLMQMIIESGSSHGSSSQNNEEEAGIF